MPKEKHQTLVLILLAVSVVLLGLGAWFLGQDWLRLQHQGIFGPYHNEHRGWWRRHPPNIDTIASWMTFNYLEKIFALPPDYLKTTLSITNPHYPYLSISAAAKEKQIPVTTFLGQVQSAIREFSSPSSTVTSTRLN